MKKLNQFFTIFVLVGLLFVFAPISSHAVVPLTCWSGEEIELEYTIEGGEVRLICDNDGPSVEMHTFIAEGGGQLTIEIPRTLVYFVNQDCESEDLIILVNDEEVNYDVENTPLSRIITLDLQPDRNFIEFIGSYTLGDDVHQYCGVIYGVKSQFLSPKKQVDKARDPLNVRCNNDLELIFKNNGSPACVKPQTAEKLVERSWVAAIESIK